MSTPTFTTPKRPLTWLVTGCSSGLGLLLTREIQSHGHTVIATSRNPSRTPELVAEVEGRGGKWLRLDVAAQDCGKLVEELEQRGTHIDVLVNNAGSSIHGVVEQLSDQEAKSQMELLYFGPYRLIRAVLPNMRKTRFGVIVNISSGAGLEGRESMGVYAAGKAALDG
jgi:short-subunit dehydrogenase